MVKRIARFLSTDFSSPELGAFAYSAVTLLVTFLGIFRERLLASSIGPGSVLDAYVLAHKIPDVLYVTTAALFVSTTLLPYLVREKTPEGKQQLMSEMYTVQLVGSAILAILFIVFNPILMPLIGPGFSAETLTMAQNMSQIILLSPILLGMSNLLGINSQINKQFIIVALSPLLYNLGTVLTLYFGYNALGYFVLPIAILFSALLHMVVQLISSRSTGIMPQLVWRIDWGRTRTIIANAIPRTFTTAIVPITALGIIGIGSHLASGSVSLLNFGIVIQNVPVTLIGGALAVASFPVLLDIAASGDRARFSARIAMSLRVMTTLALPITALMYVLRNEVVGLLLSSGNFTIQHAATTAGIVGVMALGLWAQSMVLVGARIYYAQGKTWSPFYQNIIGMAVALGFAYGVAYLWGANLYMLALAFLLGWWTNAIISLIRISSLYCTRTDIRHMLKGMMGALLVSFAVFIVAYYVRGFVVDWNLGSKLITTIAQGLVVGGAGVLVGIGALLLIGDTESKMFVAFLRKKFRV